MKKYKSEIMRYFRSIMNSPPAFIGLLLNPHFLIRYHLNQGLQKVSNHVQGVTLDFGCGSKPFVHFFTCINYIGVDIEISGHDHTSSEVDVYYDGKVLPFSDEFFDSIFSCEVLEHVPNFTEIIPELSRVIKSGGSAVITVPFIWPEHELPYDYYRFTRNGLVYQFEQQNFELIEHHRSGNCILVIGQLITDYILRLLPFGKLNFIFTPLLIAPIHLICIFINYVLPRDDRLYWNSIFVFRKK